MCIFDVVTHEIVLLDTYKITNLVNWVCFNCKIVEPYVHWTIQSHHFDIKVVFLFQKYKLYLNLIARFKTNCLTCNRNYHLF